MTNLGLVWSVNECNRDKENEKDVEREPFDMGQQAIEISLSRKNELNFENVISRVYTS
jgi:hypothetical protein